MKERSTIPYTPPPKSHKITIAEARVTLPPEEFRLRLRKHMLNHPGLTLAQVARELKLTRQRVSSIVGPLHRPTCAQPGPRPAPKTEEVKARLPELELRVFAGESVGTAAAALGLSVNQIYVLGFRARSLRAAHGTKARFDSGCRCWRCRKSSGAAKNRAREDS